MKIVGKMITDIFSFFILYVILALMFALICNINFITIEGYSTFMDSIYTVIDCSLGNYDLYAFRSLDSEEEILGQLLTVAMIVIFNILLLNLIIAILANTYNTFDSRSNGLYLSKILISRDELAYDESYGALFTSMPPLNLVQLPLVGPALFLRYKAPALNWLNN